MAGSSVANLLKLSHCLFGALLVSSLLAGAEQKEVITAVGIGGDDFANFGDGELGLFFCEIKAGYNNASLD